MIFNVAVTKTMTMVVVADNENHAKEVAHDYAEQAFDDAFSEPLITVMGEVATGSHLRDGWDKNCVPYGGDGNTRLMELLKA